jgi:hypothetical protein
VSIRVYLPTTLATMRHWREAGAAAPAPLAAHTVTREFARDYGAPDAPDDDEMLQFEVLTDAALASAAADRLAGDDPAVLVLEADVEASSVERHDGDGSSVSVLTAIPAGSWVALYRQSSDTVGVPVTSLSAADLTWFAVQELADVLDA